MNNPNNGWWQSFNPPEPYDANASSASDDWKFSGAVWGLIVAAVGLVIWIVASIL